jgi:hypothetical protein
VGGSGFKAAVEGFGRRARMEESWDWERREVSARNSSS